ncbi:hypothetical protein DK926_04980 [Rhodococcus sp. Eu-32]|uniref:hypothetical protein n=1 Tax=Rhodococcus sp. Eu-32 TaxID=1017319 RepID=UPI000DF438D4|nr:hypothetical protein [Rhodococcus sp. Eu-32]RRQ29237.1 hypothetical protein DK926_04980 [Rhodococcus sp. Eu-32]
MSIGEDELPDDARPTADDGPFTVIVDGETFTVTARPGESGSYDYTWESGPNEGYGYSSSLCKAYPSVLDRANDPSAFEPSSVAEHRESIRDFLLQINPDTGYIGD